MWWIMYCDGATRVVLQLPPLGACGPNNIWVAYGAMPLCNDEPELQ